MTGLEIAKACLQAYVDKDRPTLEALVADDFHFTSPLDNRLDRAAYFQTCWPNSVSMDSATVVAAAQTGDRVFVVYEATAAGRRFRNCELHTVRGAQLVAVEVYFGWNLPHPAPPGRHADPQAPSR